MFCVVDIKDVKDVVLCLHYIKEKTNKTKQIHSTALSNKSPRPAFLEAERPEFKFELCQLPWVTVITVLGLTSLTSNMVIIRAATPLGHYGGLSEIISGLITVL